MRGHDPELKLECHALHIVGEVCDLKGVQGGAITDHGLIHLVNFRVDLILHTIVAVDYISGDPTATRIRRRLPIYCDACAGLCQNSGPFEPCRRRAHLELSHLTEVRKAIVVKAASFEAIGKAIDETSHVEFGGARQHRAIVHLTELATISIIDEEVIAKDGRC